MSAGDSKHIQTEFDRVASVFTKRTAGRFDNLNAVEFSQVEEGATVLEVGVGTGEFLQLFRERAGLLVGVDLTAGMLAEARHRHPEMLLTQGDGAALPLASGSMDLATSAQVFHHISRPLPVLFEMRRVIPVRGRALIVDQIATERYEEAVVLNRLEQLRDPTHAASRPPSALRTLVLSAGLEIVAERIDSTQNRVSDWIPEIEFPAERIEQVRDFISRFGAETGLGFEPAGDDFIYTRSRMMILAARQ